MGGLGVFGHHAVDLRDLGLAPDAEHLGGNASVSTVTATSGFARSARTRYAAWLTCGAEMNVGSTSSSPVHANQLATTRGVPSSAVYAYRAGIVELSSRFARSLSSSLRLPCSIVIWAP